MDITGFLATIASNFRNKYLNLAQEFSHLRPPVLNKPANQPTPVESEGKPACPVDHYEPSGKPIPESTATGGATPDTNAPTTTPENPVEKNPDGTYYYQRQARLDYQLDLQFDLGAITQTIEKMADGETGAVEQFAAAGFGLHADFDIRGIQRVRTNMAEADDPGNRHQLTAASTRQASKFLFQSRDFALESFYSEASRIRRSLQESVRGTHRRAVNKFAARFRLDNRFSFAHLERFNVQTERITNDMPDEVANYVGSAGEIASKGSAEIMATFFDAVDSYLEDTEEAVLEKVTAFFDHAAEELGFSGAMVEQARAHLAGTIESFFGRADSAMAELETRFIPEPQVVSPMVETEPTELVIPATPQSPEPYADAAAKDKYTLATA